MDIGDKVWFTGCPVEIIGIGSGLARIRFASGREMVVFVYELAKTNA